MSLRLEMLQVARVAPKALGESVKLVEAFFRRQFAADGGGVDRDGRSDLYYTIFSLAGLQALQAEAPVEKVEVFLRGFGDGVGLDFVHLGALARCWAAIGLEKMPDRLADALLARMERHRSHDGGYDSDAGSAQGLRLVSADRAATRMRPLACALSALLADRELFGKPGVYRSLAIPCWGDSPEK